MGLRLTHGEKSGFTQGAELVGRPLSSWVREKFRLAAIRELENPVRHVPFVTEPPLGKHQ